jgi:hypothetical protein
MISIAFAESAGVFGLLVYMLTGDIILAIALNAVAFFAVLYNIPRREEIEERRRELHLQA